MNELLEVAKQALQYIKEGETNKPHFIKHAEEVIKKFDTIKNTKEEFPFLKKGEVRLHCNGDFIDVEEQLKNYLADHNFIDYDGKQWTFVEENANEIIKIKNACK